ncbi:hypothetical protein EDD29_3299 [Actinocorallia herbida]|uniref:Lipoprotein n=1 Tax=Actinocorallia herbida TaxID=58109 RepID=A0A3N1CWS2_9ACTN|nr:hypothetical protein [Actinocorallia herbida]ROO85750.1 hypothetical protein EDD29_3299 [Actinocorallia herbida]
MRTCAVLAALLLTAACGTSDGGDVRLVVSANPGAAAGAAEVPLTVILSTAWSGGIGSDIPGQKFCRDLRERGGKPVEGQVSCRFTAPRGTVVNLTATVRDRHPSLVVDGSNERLTLCENGSFSAATRTATCTITLTTGTVLCLEDGMGEPIASGWVRGGHARLPATAPPGFVFGPYTAPSLEGLLG